ncbi:uncharacterized protein FRV6_04292 [Fusarium oxysporum]|uniref:Uncharacterized protein n=1 Tax=Fusarium oxysporum TaxID=5507 RepID=A0A2H3SXW2_FUSOX|nr:uncharacterized protein FRV6_04292 [Fusarium oxysporum]
MAAQGAKKASVWFASSGVWPAKLWRGHSMAAVGGHWGPFFNITRGCTPVWRNRVSESPRCFGLPGEEIWAAEKKSPRPRMTMEPVETSPPPCANLPTT